MHYAVEGEDPAAVIKIIDALIAKGASVLVDDADGKIPAELTTNREVKSYLGRCAEKELIARAPEMSHTIVAPIPIRAHVSSLEWLLGIPKEAEASRREQPVEKQPAHNQAPIAGTTQQIGESSSCCSGVQAGGCSLSRLSCA